MSDLLIRGMEMPKDRGVYIAIDIDGQAYTKPVGALGWNKLKQKAVSVPPHGRLTDVDKVLDDLAHNLGIRSLDYLTPNERAIVSWFRDAPTIIPAEPCNNPSKPCKKEAAP